MKGNIHKIVVNCISTRLQWRRIVQGAFCKHDEIASPDEFTSPYAMIRLTWSQLGLQTPLYCVNESGA